MMIDAAYTDVSTYIQSGNVVFRAKAGPNQSLQRQISNAIEKRFGFACPVVVRSAEELAATVRNNPFHKKGSNENELHVMFLADEPTSEALSKLDPQRSPGDEFLVRGKDIYLRLPNGVARSKLTNAYFDSKLNTTSTARNWRTILTLLEIAIRQ